MSFSIRRAQIGDAGAIGAVQVAGWKTTYRGIVPDEYLDALDEEERRLGWVRAFEEDAVAVFVAADALGVFGFAAGGAIRQPIPGYEGELYAIYLLRERQRSGAGRALVRAVAGELAAQGHKSMAVWVLEANPAVGFYRRLGAVPAMRQGIEIGGLNLPELALGWPDLRVLAEETGQFGVAEPV